LEECEGQAEGESPEVRGESFIFPHFVETVLEVSVYSVFFDLAAHAHSDILDGIHDYVSDGQHCVLKDFLDFVGADVGTVVLDSVLQVLATVIEGVGHCGFDEEGKHSPE
jgi:hypothetical protein